ncbi:hypothetical protein AMK10_19300 [Streptomyces sp. CB02058]|nr:hypothetical protein AMK10_19300 [Streptomyces sp. CB02058]
MQNAFAKVLRRPTSVEYPVSYLRVVIRTEAANRARQQARHSGLEARRAADPLRFDPLQSPDVAALVANRCAVEQAMGALTPSQRAAVWATKGLDCTQAETAVMMEKAPGTVAVHVSRGMALLRASLVAAVVAGIVCVVGHFIDEPLQGTPPAREPSMDSSPLSPQWWSGKPALLSALYAHWPVFGPPALIVTCGVVCWLWRRFRAHDRAETPFGTWWGLRRTGQAWQSSTNQLGLPFTAREFTRDAIVFVAPSDLSAEAVLKGSEAVTILMERKLGRIVHLELFGGLSSRQQSSPGSRLRNAFDLTGWSRGELARMVNRQAAALGYRQLTTDTSRVRRWLDQGEIPRDPVPQLLAALFTERLGRVVTAEDLGMTRPASEWARRSSTEQQNPDALPWAPERTAVVLTEFTAWTSCSIAAAS